MAHRRRFGARVDGKGRETFWVNQVPIQVQLASVLTASFLSSFNAAALALRPFTIVRTRGIFTARSDQSAGTESYQCALGMSIVSDQASAVGVTAVPTPFTDMVSDMFFVYEQLYGAQLFKTGVGVVEPQGVSMQFDSKAMRRVNDGQDIAVTVENSAIGDGLFAIVGFRMLIKLH